MKKLKLTIAIIVLTFFTCGSILGQVWHVNVVVSFDEYDYTPYAPYLGIVSGTFTYRYAIKLSEAGKIESVHWMVQDCNLHNQDGEKVLFVDNGHDNLGIIWDFFNKPDFYNGYDPKLQYSSDEGWLDNYMPALLPVEGTFVDMSFKMMVKGKKWDVYAAMVQIHMNANGVITANVTKP